MKPFSLQFEAIGTSWEIEAYEPLDKAAQAQLTAAIHARIETFDRAYSRFRPDSAVSAMASSAGHYRLPADAGPMMALYRELYDLTDGAMTPLIGQSLVQAGYDAHYSLQPGQLTHVPKWDEVLAWHDPTLTLKQPAWLDFGAAGKGHLVDLVADVIESAGVHAYLVDAGGDMLHRQPGGQPIDVGLEHPGNTSQVVGVAHLANQSLCGSAGNRRAWGNFHHIIDPRILASPTNIRAIWVTASSTMLADALTTALYMVPPSHLSTRYNFEYALVRDDYSLDTSPNFPATFFH